MVLLPHYDYKEEDILLHKKFPLHPEVAFSCILLCEYTLQLEDMPPKVLLGSYLSLHTSIQTLMIYMEAYHSNNQIIRLMHLYRLH